jgi:hypothetical protein
MVQLLTGRRDCSTGSSRFHHLVDLGLATDIHVRQAFDINPTGLVLVYRQVVILRCNVISSAFRPTGRWQPETYARGGP